MYVCMYVCMHVIASLVFQLKDFCPGKLCLKRLTNTMLLVPVTLYTISALCLRECPRKCNTSPLSQSHLKLLPHYSSSGGFRGGSGGSLEPPSGTKLFHFHGEIYEKSGKILKTNPLLMDMNPPFRNPGSPTV